MVFNWLKFIFLRLAGEILFKIDSFIVHYLEFFIKIPYVVSIEFATQ